MNNILKTKFLFVRNQSGIAIFLALIILFIVTIAGMTILVVAHKDKVLSKDGSIVRDVSTTALAALKACENQMSSQSGFMTEVLNKNIIDKSYRWFFSSNASGAKSEKKIAIGNGYSYSAEITAYDKTNHIMQVRGIGYGRNGEEKSITAIYRINGLRVATSTTSDPRYAVYLAGDGRNFDSRFEINGDLYVGSDFHINGGASNSVIKGFLKTGLNTSFQSGIDANNVTVDSSVYIGTGLKLNRSFTINGKLGVEGALELYSPLVVKKDGWFNGSNGGTSIINMSGNTIHHSGSIAMSRVSGGTEDKKVSPITDIALQVGVGLTNDNAWQIDTANLRAKAQPIYGSIDADSLQRMFDRCSSSNKYNGYMVITDGGGTFAMNSSTHTFNGKVIFFLQYGINVNSKFFNMTTTSRILIIACKGASIQEFGGTNLSSYNGVIYLMDHAGITMKSAGEYSLLGAIHVASRDASWQMNSSSTTYWKFIFDKAIVNEFVSMGIIRVPPQGGSSSSGAAGTIVQTDFKIRPEMVSISY